MTKEGFAELDHWLQTNLLRPDPVLDAVHERAREAGLPAINVSAMLGAFLQVLARGIGAQRILEIGTLAGFSTIHMARGLADSGRVVTIEVDPAHAEVARGNFERAGILDRVDLRVGPALDILPQLAAEDATPFDLAFLDADKESNAAYADWAARLLRPGGLMVIDNVVQSGAVLDSAADTGKADVIRQLFAAIRSDDRFQPAALQIVGSKGWDEILIASRR